MDSISEQIEGLRSEALREIGECSDAKGLEQLRVKYLGRKGKVTAILRSIGSLPKEERPFVGKLAGELKRLVLQEIERKTKELGEVPMGPGREFFDISLPGRAPFYGRKHPLTLVTEEIIRIFRGMGFTVVRGPEVELDYYNFDALNTPEDHPARDVHDTFYLWPGTLLRTHTSPVQVRVMEKMRPPVRIISPGRCYRNDTPDATHYPVFHQVEGLYVDRNVTFGDLKGVISSFARQLFGEDVKVRFRPDFFPFTEPSAEYSFSCVFCRGKGCRICKETGWLEISGAGMVDPKVFSYVDYDPEEFTGFAFGMGVERIAMLKYGVEDIRLFYENDLRFLRQF